MKPTASLVGPLLQGFFVEHLLRHKQVSPQTVASYRDTFRLLLQYLQRQLNIEPAALRITALDAPTILSFLDSLEQERNNSARSRNVRLAAIRTFFRWVTLRDPEYVGLATRVLAIPAKRTDRRLVQSLTRPEINALLAAPDLKAWRGRRDHALLLTLYNTGARVSEIITLQRNQIQFGTTAFVQLTGKGRKQRSVPLWPKTANTLKKWFSELDASIAMAFPSSRGKQLSRNGVDYLLKQAVDRAQYECPSLRNKRVSPHVVRHSTAMHLLQSGVDISVIALWLGHEGIETTHIYVEADLATKELALQKLAPAGEVVPRFRATDKVLAFLSTL